MLCILGCTSYISTSLSRVLAFHFLVLAFLHIFNLWLMSANDTTGGPPDGLTQINWKSPEEVQATVQLLFNCLATLAFCVWGALHVDIEQRTKVRALLHKIGWVMCAIFAPELLVVIAYKQWRAATWLIRENRRRLKIDASSEKNQALSSAEGAHHLSRPRRHVWTLVHGFYASMGGFVIDLRDSVKDSPQDFLPDCYHNLVTLTTEGVDFLLEHDPDFIPMISEDSIMDHSKADGVSKTLQLAQVTWFCVNCGFRRAKGVPLSLLEVYTLAHAMCMIIVYLIWLKKPFDIKEPTIIRGKLASETCALLHELSERHSSSGGHNPKRQPLADRALNRLGLKRDEMKHRKPLVVERARLIIWAEGATQLDPSLVFALASLGALYGGVHCLPWNGEFPTSVEKQLWHIAAVILTSAATCEGSFLMILSEIDRIASVEWLAFGISICSFILLPLAYCLANLYIVVESVRQLLYLPAEAYQVTVWSNYWPHFG